MSVADAKDIIKSNLNSYPIDLTSEKEKSFHLSTGCLVNGMRAFFKKSSIKIK